MIDEFKQWGNKHRKLLYFSYNQLKYISRNPLLDSSGPLIFEPTRIARRKVYPSLSTKKWVRIEKIDVQSHKGTECVAITKTGIDTARQRIDEIGNNFSMDANAWNNKGDALDKLGRHIEAISCYDTALRIDPNFALPWNNKGKSLISLENYDKAIQCLDRAIEITPNLAIAWDNKAWALYNLKKYDESIQCLDIALKIAPNFAIALYRKGCTLKELGKHNEATQYIEKARQLGFEG